MSSSPNTSKCDVSSSSIKKEAPEISSNKKASTSCDHKVESCNNDRVSSDNSSAGGRNSSSGIDTISDSLGRVDISNDDDDKMSISDEKLFQDPPPKEDCPSSCIPHLQHL